MVEGIHTPVRVNGHTSEAKSLDITLVKSANRLPPAKVNGQQLQPATTTKSKLSEEMVRETFGHFGSVERVVLPAKHGKHARHGYISELKVIISCLICLESEQFLTRVCG